MSQVSLSLVQPKTRGPNVLAFAVLSSSRLQAANSPSVSLEKGLGRLRPPNRRQTTPSPAPLGRKRFRHISPSTPKKPLRLLFATLIGILIVALTLFLVLIVWRWEVHHESLPATLSESSRPLLHSISVGFNNRSSPVSLFNPSPYRLHAPAEKYLAYLPHSGFHNQRVSLENALVLARLMKRVLIVPPIRLGLPIRHFEFDKLYRNAALSSKRGLEHCNISAVLSSIVPPECMAYHEFTLVPWSVLIDTQQLSLLYPIVERWDTSTAWVRRYLNVGDAETANIKELHPYQFQFFDSSDDSRPLKAKYSERIDIPNITVEYDQYRLIHFGTLFGTTRLRLSLPDSTKVRRQVRELMVFQNPLLLHIARSISFQVAGENRGGYIGIHLRLGDSFANDGDKNSRIMWWALLHRFLRLSLSEIVRIETDALGLNDTLRSPNLADLYSDGPASRFTHAPLTNMSDFNHSRQHNCFGSPHSRPERLILNTPIYIATDAKKPRTHLSLKLFLRTLPCTFFLADFEGELSPLKTSGLLINDDEGLRVDTFLLPFVDAMVASMGREALGTPHSTFSRFTVDVLHRVYHDWPIVERG